MLRASSSICRGTYLGQQRDYLGHNFTWYAGLQEPIRLLLRESVVYFLRSKTKAWRYFTLILLVAQAMAVYIIQPFNKPICLDAYYILVRTSLLPAFRISKAEQLGDSSQVLLNRLFTY